MFLFYKLFKKDPNSRENIVSMTSGLGIVVNVLLAAMKVIVGLLSSSIAIVSEGVNNATDVFTSVLTLLGTKLAGKHPDAKHPFGYGRIEYLTSLIVSALILVAGVEMTKSSIEMIIHPEELNISIVAVILVAVSAVVKLLLGFYTIKMGKKSGSKALEGVGVECRNDSIVSVVTIISTVVYLVFEVSIDAYAGVIMSLFIIKAGFDLLRETISELLGRPGEKELATKIYQEVRSTEGILNAADMMLHNYGPDAWSGSVNIEIDHEKTVGEIYQVIHALQLRIMHEYHVTMVFGMYAVDNDHEEVKMVRKAVATFVKLKEHVKSFHAIYLEPGTNRIYCDLIVDYELKNWDELRSEFLEYMKESYPDNEVVLTIETEFV